MKAKYRLGRVVASASCLILMACPVFSGQAIAQLPQPSISAQPVPGSLELAKLVWTTMAAIDHANQSGNYSVLRDISAPGFQLNNDAAKLAQIFSGVRATGIDLSNTLLLAPTYTAPPAITNGVMRVQGYFGLRPTAVAFDLYYQWAGGRWRLFGVSINPRSIASIQPTPTEPLRQSQTPGAKQPTRPR